jgi:hypothetical protein
LFAAMYAAAAGALGRAGDVGRRWLAFGVLAGFAYLAKATGELLLASAVIAAVDRWKAGAFEKRQLWLAAAGFAAVAFFLLYRNAAVWRNPFHHVGSRAMWLDDFSQFWPQADREWSEARPLVYWRSHSIGSMLMRLVVGAAVAALHWTQASGVGPESASAGTGLILPAAAAAGLRKAWKGGQRQAVLAVVAPAVPTAVLLSWAGMAGIAGTRFWLPLAASTAPFAASAILGWTKKSRAPLFLLLGAAAASVIFSAARGAFAAGPLSYWEVSAQAAETSAYLKANVDAGGFLIPYESDFSAWNAGKDLRKPYPFLSPDEELLSYMSRHGIAGILLDGEAPSSFALPRRLGPSDAFGPTTFLGWERRFHDGAKPSRFLFYRRTPPN